MGICDGVRRTGCARPRAFQRKVTVPSLVPAWQVVNEPPGTTGGDVATTVVACWGASAGVFAPSSRQVRPAPTSNTLRTPGWTTSVGVMLKISVTGVPTVTVPPGGGLAPTRTTVAVTCGGGVLTTGAGSPLSAAAAARPPVRTTPPAIATGT